MSHFAAIVFAVLGLLAATTAVPPAAYGAEGSASSADGVQIHYRDVGAGEPVLLFVHCWACNRQFWDAQADHFARRHRVVTIDLGGHGASAGTRREWTIPAFAEDVLAIVRKLDLGRIVLIGHSMGGPVILEVARRIPERVLALVPVDTLLDVEQTFDASQKEAMLAALRADYRGATGRFMRENMFVPATDPKLIERIVGTATAMPPPVAISAIGHAIDYDARPALREIRAPIVAINANKIVANLDSARRSSKPPS